MIITVKPGDTVYSLSIQYGVEERKLTSDNGIIDDTLVVGQSLIIRRAKDVFYSQNGNTVSEISSLTGVSERRIFENNYFLGGKSDVNKGETVILSYIDEPSYSTLIGGYAYDFISIDRLKQVINYLSLIMPFTYGFTEEGELIKPSDEYIITLAKMTGVTPLLHISTLTQEGVFDSNLPSVVFENQAARENLLAKIISEVEVKGYGGVDIDFEFLPSEQKQNYIAFTKELSQRLHSISKILIIALPPKTSDEQRGLLYESADYGALGENADFVLLMTYEYGYRFGPPQAIAPINRLREVIEYAKTRIPENKLLLGLSNYGYDWTLPYVRGVSDAPSISGTQAIEIAKKYGAEIGFDTLAMAPYFYYTDEGGKEHAVWFEDARSFEAKAELIREYSLAGGLIWELSRDNPQGFVTLASAFNIPLFWD